MKLGVLVEAEEGLDWERWNKTIAAAERLGFESVWISDHLASPWAAERHGLEPWVALGVAAARSQRVRLGPLVSPITFRPAALIARMAEAIDELAPGRLVIGLGLGWNADEHARFAIPFPSAPERIHMLADGIELVRRMLGERRVPVLIGGAGRGTLRVVAQHADEWNVTTASVDVYMTGSERLTELCKQIGRDPCTIRRSIAAGVLIGRNEAELRARSERMQQLVLPLSGIDVGDVPAASRRMGWLAGTPDQIVAELTHLARAGVDLAILGHYDPADVQALELIATEVMPALA